VAKFLQYLEIASLLSQFSKIYFLNAFVARTVPPEADTKASN